MKNKIVVLALAALGSAPGLAAAAVHPSIAWPPGPTIWAWIVHLIGA